MLRSGIRLLGALVLALATVAAGQAPAGADQPVVLREPFPQGSATITGSCSFPVFVDVTQNRAVVTIRVDPDGTQHLQVRGTTDVTVTNTTNGKSTAIRLTNPVDVTVKPDGSQNIIFRGLTMVFFANPANLPPGLQPGAFITHGLATLSVSGTGTVLAFTPSTHMTNVCQLLA